MHNLSNLFLLEKLGVACEIIGLLLTTTSLCSSQMQLASFLGLPTVQFWIANPLFASCEQSKARLWESLFIR